MKTIKSHFDSLTPQKIVAELDKHIVGQANAKRSVAIALRNRFRRMQVDPALRGEITPKNILMIGPTGVGKTEIARRLAKIANAPFIKIEATKFTEVGYVGRDVESIIRDLVETAVKQTREQALSAVQVKAQQAAEERVLDALLPGSKKKGKIIKQDINTIPADYMELNPTFSANNIDFPHTIEDSYINSAASNDSADASSTREIFRQKLRAHELDEKEIEFEISQANIGVEIMAPPGMEEMTNQLQSMFQSINSDKKRLRKMKVKDAYKLLQDEEAAKLVNDQDLKAAAIEAVEQTGIVFLDEIDKITRRSSESHSGSDISREGVQRDLLPLIEGSTVSTKYGMVKTDHILFIASGAFHLSKPSDLIPELQGRLPIRVELNALTADDFFKILTEPDASLTVQNKALLATENVELHFTNDGIARIADIAWRINEKTENIGARRLHTVFERLLENISFTATELTGQKVTIDEKYVLGQLQDLSMDEDLSRFIL